MSDGSDPVLSYLGSLQRFGLRPGLETSRALAAALGHPERHLRFLHVAGTNGKGSTCAFLESIYRHSGLRVGLYTSPHLISFRERIQIDRAWMPPEAVHHGVARLREIVETWDESQQPTFFEFTTALALLWFAEQGCDLVVWETGLGGRLDATNIVTPLASVITNIGWDHMAWLGNSLAAIAAEKAGIIKPGIPVVTATTEPSALAVIRETASRLAAPLHEVTPVDLTDPRLDHARLPLRGEHQRWNAATALAVVDRLRPALSVPDSALSAGLETTRWPGRFEVLHHGRTRWVLDGAHNRPAIEALSAELARQFPGERYALILGMLADKETAVVTERLVPEARRTLVVPIQSSRGGDPEVLAETCRRTGAEVEVAKDFGEAVRRLDGEPLVVITGSLYLVGEALGHFQGQTFSERSLNDWSPTR